MQQKILAISGSTRAQSSNGNILRLLAEWAGSQYAVEIFEDLAALPHFNPDLDTDTPPTEIVAFREKVAAAAGIIICTPEYVFSLPGSLKNALEWLVSTTIITEKPVGQIVASASGRVADEELHRVLATIQATLSDDARLVISGVKGKFDAVGNLIDAPTEARLRQFWAGFEAMLVRT